MATKSKRTGTRVRALAVAIATASLSAASAQSVETPEFRPGTSCPAAHDAYATWVEEHE